jgi:ubiquinone/menaquinone biosynthesis C-methylase UbiE
LTSPFDTLASTYAAQWSDSAEGRSQREEVWREIDALFQTGDRVLDLGCGIGDDALHLMTRGIGVLGIDQSAAMVERARARGVAAELLPIEHLSGMSIFDGALCNFGALNCVADWSSAAQSFSRLIKPGGILVICTFTRFSWRETSRYVRQGDLKRATRRWWGQAQWRGVTIYYRSRWQTARAFAPYFSLTRRVSVGGGDHQLFIFRRRA